MLKKTGMAALVCVVLLALTETGFRLAGMRPYEPYVRKMNIEPYSPYVYDSVTGYKLAPGRFTFFDEGSSFTATHDAKGFRITADSITATDSVPTINFFGGPATYGYGVNDNESFPYVFQTMLPCYKVNNYAVPGFGIMGNYLNLIQTPHVKPGDLFVLIYNPDANSRPSRGWEKAIYASVQNGLMKNLHLVRPNIALQPVVEKYEYQICPLSYYSAAINFAEDYYNYYHDTHSGNETAQKAFVAMHEWCKARGATFVLVGRKRNPECLDMLSFCNKHGVKTASLVKQKISFNIGNHGNINEKAFKERKLATSRFCNDIIDYLKAEKLIATGTCL